MTKVTAEQRRRICPTASAICSPSLSAIAASCPLRPLRGIVRTDGTGISKLPFLLTHCSVPSNTVVIARPARREDEPTPRVGCRYPAVRDAATRRATIMLLRRPPAAGPIGKTRRASGPGKAGWLALQMASATVAAGRSLALHRADPYEHNRTPTSGRSA